MYGEDNRPGSMLGGDDIGFGHSVGLSGLFSVQGGPEPCFHIGNCMLYVP